MWLRGKRLGRVASWIDSSVEERRLPAAPGRSARATLGACCAVTPSNAPARHLRRTNRGLAIDGRVCRTYAPVRVIFLRRGAGAQFAHPGRFGAWGLFEQGRFEQGLLEHRLFA